MSVKITAAFVPSNLTRDTSAPDSGSDANDLNSWLKGTDNQFALMPYGEWVTLEIDADEFAFSSTRSTFTLSDAAETHNNSVDGSLLLSSGGEILSRVATTAATDEWSLSGTTVSIHEDITANGKTYQIHYLTVTSGSSGPSPVIRGGFLSGSMPTWQSVTTVRIPSDYRAIDPDTGVMIAAGSNLDVDITASGALGLDTGSEAGSTFYYLWICSGSSGTTGILSLSATTPTLPAGYDTNKSLVKGAWLNNSSSDLVFAALVHMGGNVVEVQSTTGTPLASGSPSDSRVSVDLTGMIPLTATSVRTELRLKCDDEGGNRVFGVYSHATEGNVSIQTIGRGGIHAWDTNTGFVAVLTAETIWYASNSFATYVQIDLRGWVE